MRYSIYLLCLLAFSVFESKAQDFQVIGGYSAESLVEIITGDELEISNPLYTGHNDSKGYFEGNSNMDLYSGAILSSGDVFLAEGPNNMGNAGANMEQAGDVDMDLLLDTETFDAAVLEFDMNPGNDSVVYFSFVFGSEEYPEYVYASYPEGCGIFISGPGIEGTFSNDAINMARLPDSIPPIYITINEVNQWDNSYYYVDNAGGFYIQYDGFTIRIVSRLTLMPNENYHIKLVVADANDYIYDSGFFIEENGITTQAVRVEPLVTHNVCYGDSTGQVELDVQGFYPPYTYNWSTGDTTSVVTDLPAGSYWCTVTDSLMNSVTDTMEVLQGDTLGFGYQYTYYEDSCLNEVTAIVSGGVPPYSYLWSDPAQQNTQTAVLCPGWYELLVTDSLGCSFTDSVEVTTGSFGNMQVGILADTNEMVDMICPEGVECFNVQYSGSPYATGTFQGYSNIGFEEGILLTTGYVWHAEGPNGSYESGVLHDLPGDPDLDMLNPGQTHDAAVLEFDFISELSELDFYFVFAGEEYDELVEDSHTDMMGFFVSGPGISGPFNNEAENFAILPSQEAVSVYTVNNGFAEPGIVPTGPCYNCEFYVHNKEQSLGYDGFTEILNAHLNVQPGESYHCKIVIADGGDKNYDAGVFIKSSDAVFTGEEQLPETSRPGFKAYVKNGHLSIIPVNNAASYRYELFDLLGRKEKSGMAQGETRINCSNLNAGVKVLRVEMDGMVENVKLMVE